MRRTRRPGASRGLDGRLPSEHGPKRQVAVWMPAFAGMTMAVLLLLTTAACAAQRPSAQAQPKSGTPMPAPAQQSMINLSLVEALVATKHEQLAGVFGLVSEANAGPAFADLLFRDPKALKLFLKKGEADLKQTGAISVWDKEVYLYLVTIQSNASLVGTASIPAKLFDRVTTLSLAPGVPLSVL